MTHTSCWTVAHLTERPGDDPETPVIDPVAVRPMVECIDLWDLWPVCDVHGDVASVQGEELWLGLAAPASGHPGERHHRARLRLVARRDGSWVDLGDVFADGASPGSREWAGSTIHNGEPGTLTIYYTAAGRRGEPRPTYVQRIMEARATVEKRNGRPVLAARGEHTEPVRADGRWYLEADEELGEPGFIKAFRDPWFFRDPATGRDALLFTGSHAGGATAFNGAVGLALRGHHGWTLRPPLITADGVNNELERPHVVVRDGRYYLFFSTQARTFHPAVDAPTGLYGFVAEELAGPYEPLNGSGLVFGNPRAEPYQAYSWLVLRDMRVASFVDLHTLRGTHPDDLERDGVDAVRRHFGGTMAPTLRIAVDGSRARIA